MSNINPNPSWPSISSPRPRAAVGGFPYNRVPLSEVEAAVERVHAKHRNPVAPPRNAIVDRKGRCRFCKGKSVEWKVGTCPECGGHGRG